MRKDEFQDTAAAFGKVLSFDLWENRRASAKSAVVEYATTDDARRAVKELEDRRIEGWSQRLSARLEK